MIEKRRTWIAAAGCVGLGVAALWTFTRTPLYESSTQIEVDSRGSAALTRDALFGVDEQSEFATHRFHLTSERILDVAAASIDLPARLRMPGAGGSWIAAHLVVERVPDTRIFRISARAPDATLAADIAQTVAAVYEADDVDRRAADARRKLAWLDEQMADVKKQVEASELALIDYIEKSDLDLVEIGSGEASATGPDLKPAGSPALRNLEAELSRLTLELERERLDKTEVNPDVKRLRDERAIVSRRIAEEKKRIGEENKKRIRYGMLRRDAELNRQMFAHLMKELKQVNLLGEDDAGRIVVLRTAEPSGGPVYPRPLRHLAFGLLSGLLFGVGAAFLQESLDRSLKTREDVERALEIPVLGVIHRVGASARMAGAPRRSVSAASASSSRSTQERILVHLDTPGWAPEVEDFRTLRTNLRFARPDGDNRTILVTSTAPEEGKTTVATNLALVMAQTGQRVLLVDADLRRPAVHVTLGIPNEVGLTNLLVAEDGRADDAAVVATSTPNLSAITAGAFAPNPPDLLDSGRMRELAKKWRGQFDRVIIDSPPQTSVVDPSILAPLVDGVLLVVAAGRVDADRARLARRQLAASGGRFYGCVLNHVLATPDGYGYGYGHGYGYGYGNGGGDASKGDATTGDSPQPERAQGTTAGRPPPS